MSEDEQAKQQDSANSDIVRIEVDAKELFTTTLKVNTGKPVQIIVKDLGLSISE